MEGKVIWYSVHRRYGFILGNDNQEYFVHQTHLAHGADQRKLRNGQQVSFEPKQSEPNWQAVKVHVIAGAKTNDFGEAPAKLKLNPFTPQDPVTDPKKFAGRRNVLLTAVDCLFNSRNILITGPRGIGKSSIAYQLLYMTEGELVLTKRLGVQLGNFQFDYLTGDHRCSEANDLPEIAQSLLSGLARNAGLDYEETQNKITTGFDFKWVKNQKEFTRNRLSPTDIANLFVAKVEEVFEATARPFNGIAFLVDEVDALGPEVGLGPFLKAALEKFRLDGHRSVCFIIGGVTGTSTALLSQHPSTRRLLERIEVAKMEDEELGEIVDLALADTEVTVSEKARVQMSALANGFPQPLHLLGYHAFRLDNNSNISARDVEAAKDYIVKHSLRQDYEEKLDRIGAGLRRDIVRRAATVEQATISFNYLSKTIRNATEHALSSDLGVLVGAGVLERHGKHVYSFRDPLFEIYCKWVFGV